MAQQFSSRLLAIEQLRAEIRRAFDDLDASTTVESAGGWVPAVDVCETDDTVILRAEVPGIEASNLELSAVGQHVKLAGFKGDDVVPGTIGCLCLERASGRFCRILHIDGPIDTSAATARLADGVLTIRIPKLKDRRLTEIPIPIETEGHK